MGTDNSYNGWSNYETWNVKLWLDNDQGTYEYMRELTQSAWDDTCADDDDDTRMDGATSTLRESLKAYIDEITPDLGASMFADILGAALSEVNYHEIARAYLEDEIDEDERNARRNEAEVKKMEGQS